MHQSGTKLPPLKRFNFPPQLTIAEALGIEISDRMLALADEVIECSERVCQPGPLDAPIGLAISGWHGAVLVACAA
jgi:hypothetical protein